MLLVVFSPHTMFHDLKFCVANLVELSSVGALEPFLQPRVILAHGLEIETKPYDSEHEYDGEKGVEVEWYGLAEEGQSVFATRHES